jgi:hypothetical protein
VTDLCIGLSGHQRLSVATYKAVADSLSEELRRSSPCTGICSLAAGADQLFADVLLHTGNKLMVVVPSADYESTYSEPADLEHYQALLAQASTVVQLDHAKPTEEAFFAAGKEVARRCDLLLAVWDGHPAAGIGGTADVVTFAREQGKQVVVIWPSGASRE